MANSFAPGTAAAGSFSASTQPGTDPRSSEVKTSRGEGADDVVTL